MKDHAYSRLSQEKEGDGQDSTDRPPGLFSHLIFSWLSKTMSLGYSRPLEEDDVPMRVVGQEDTADLTFKLEAALEAHSAAESKGKKIKLWCCLLKVLAWGDYVSYILTMLGDSVCRFAQPILLSVLLKELSRDTVSKWSYVFASGIAVTLFLQPFFKSHCEYVANIIASKMRSSLRGYMYKKVLNSTHQSLNEIGSGKVVSLASKDLKPIHTFVKRFPYVFLAPVEVVLLTVLLWSLVGIEALAGVLYLLLIALYLYVTYTPLKKMRKETTKLTGKRITQIENIVNAMRLVKMSTWEAHFMGSVDEVRKKEIRVIRYRSAVLASIMAVVSSCPVLPSFLSLVTLMATGHSLTPRIVFTTISLMGTVEVSFANYCYQGVYYATQFNATMERLQNFLFKQNSARNTNEGRLKNVAGGQHLEHGTRKSLALHKKEAHVTLSSVTSLIGKRGIFLLKEASANFQGNEFVGITGPIGSGKSSLLRVIAGELEMSEGTISSFGKVAYVAQIPWLFSGTIRDNILFGEELDEKRLSAILDACALSEDLERFPLGELSYVGERGVTLSGGQRARVGLARAVYSNADIYLLDDPLSSVDPKVGAHIVGNCIHGLLTEKLVLLVTHRLQYLQTTDRIVFMKNGSVAKEATYMELANSQDENFRDFNKAKEKSEETSHDDVTSNDKTDAVKQPADGEAEKETKEDRQYGGVAWMTYWRYLRAGNSLAFLILLAIIVILPEAFNTSSNVWLSKWTELPEHEKKETNNLLVYSAVVGGSVILEFIRAFVVIHAALKSSGMLHKNMLRAVLRAPLRFFDTSPTGRILNRFSSDVDCMDERLPRDLLDVLQRLVFTAMAVILVSMVNLWVFIPAVPMVVAIFFLCRYYLRTSRETKRLSLITASPVFSHYVETIQGIETIRAYRKEHDFFSLLCRHQDHNTRQWLVFNATQVWFGLRTDILFALFSTAVIFTSIFLNTNAGVTGLSITYAIQLVSKSLLALISVSRMENWMTSTQRVIKYTDLEPEPGYDVTSHVASRQWNRAGELQLQHVSLRHYPGGPKALEDVTCTIPSGQKVGIIGRTGAGKSSLVAALFRIPDHEGKVLLGDVCLSELNLLEARGALTAIPQDPIFFTGTLRDNLDPSEEFDDAEIWSALEKVHIKALLERTPDKLSSHVTERGSNFSVGERQLFCLARALLQKRKVIVFDEATANVDYATERLIHETIKSQLADCTVLTIAHRMTNVMEFDSVLVLDKGRLVEFDKPGTLIGQKDSIFAQLVHLSEQ